MPRSAYLLFSILLVAGCNNGGGGGSADCGDGVLDPAGGEQCDDANTDDGDGCDSSCVLENCGNGMVEPAFGEVCDDGNSVGGDGCGPTCLIESCGNGFLDVGEGCDDGDLDPTDECPDGPLGSCQNATCGDGAVWTTNATTAEECDDGNTSAGDGCDDTCMNEGPAVCGDGILQSGEQCDDSNVADDDDCLSSCVVASCGDGVQNTAGSNVEGCDDGDGILADACPDGLLGSCQPAACGDGFTYIAGYGGAEECDDGGTAPGDGCDASCLNEAASCGDGVIDAGETCDDGMLNSDVVSGDCGTVCRTSCQCPGCGDGVVDYALVEACDDWNTTGGDGCSPICTIEPIASCGDGAVNPSQGELCDDGNLLNGDGCSAQCQFETLGALCGDGNVDSLEVCDDSNVVNGDGCNPTCSQLGDASHFISVPGIVDTYADNTYLWMASEPNGTIERVDIQACITALAGGMGCTVETVLTGLGGATSYPTSDGSTLWFGFADFNNAGPHIVELDIAACESAGLPCNGTEQIVAGTASWGGYQDGVGTAAAIDGLRGLTYQGGKVYFVDGGRGTLRSFDPTTARVTTLVGPVNGGGMAGGVEGYGNAARLGSPRYMTTDGSGNLYITDNADDRIYRYNNVTGYLEAWVGSGNNGYTDSADPTMADLDRPRDITSDGTSVYWAAYDGFTIRQADIVTGAVSTLVGQAGVCGDTPGAGSMASLGKPWGMAFHHPSGSLFAMTGQFNGDASGTGECVGQGTIPDVIWRVR